MEPVVASTAAEPIVASAAAKPVVASATAEIIDASAAAKDVVTSAAVKPVVASAAAEIIVASTAAEPIVASATTKPVVASAAAEIIVASATAEIVTAGTTMEPIVASTAAEPIVASATTKPVVASAAAEIIVASAAAEIFTARQGPIAYIIGLAVVVVVGIIIGRLGPGIIARRRFVTHIVKDQCRALRRFRPGTNGKCGPIARIPRKRNIETRHANAGARRRSAAHIGRCGRPGIKHREPSASARGRLIDQFDSSSNLIITRLVT